MILKIVCVCVFHFQLLGFAICQLLHSEWFARVSGQALACISSTQIQLVRKQGSLVRGGGGCYSLSRTELCSRPGELMVSFVFIIFFSCISQSPLFIFFDFSSDLTFLVFFHLVLFYLMMMNMGSQTMGLQSCVSVCLSLCHTQSVLRLYTPPLSPVYPPRPRITAL